MEEGKEKKFPSRNLFQVASPQPSIRKKRRGENATSSSYNASRGKKKKDGIRREKNVVPTTGNREAVGRGKGRRVRGTLFQETGGVSERPARIRKCGAFHRMGEKETIICRKSREKTFFSCQISLAKTVFKQPRRGRKN